MHLQDRTAIVTGGAIRLGKALALTLAEQGTNVCLHCSHPRKEAHQALDEIRTLGVDADLIAADFLQPVQAARRVMDFVKERFGTADVLVNSAAIFEPGTLQQTDESQWDRHFNINLKAPFFLTQEFVALATFLPGLNSSKAIVNIADWRGTVPVTGHLAYTLTKSALITQTKLLAQELGPHIRVNAIAPGAILPAVASDPAAFQWRSQFNPLRRTGQPADICEALLFLLKSDFITGEVIHVTGGEQLAPGRDYV